MYHTGASAPRFPRCGGRRYDDVCLFEDSLFSPMKRGATCRKNRRRVGKQQHMMNLNVGVQSQYMSHMQFVHREYVQICLDNNPQAALPYYPCLVHVCKRRDENYEANNGSDHGASSSQQMLARRIA
jgi:hypothetical protein